MAPEPLFQVDELSAALQAHLYLSTQEPPKKKKDVKTHKKKHNAPGPKASPETEQSHYDRWKLLDHVDYGYLAANGGKGIRDTKSGRYLTTAINYTNGPAHMGHAYEAATSDVLARYYRLLGDQPAYFLTGSDEHGQKIAGVAEKDGKQPIEICDLYVTGFQVLNQRIAITNDDYLRTTSARHKRTAQELWKRCAAAGDIYLDTYSGWYNVREETFVTESEAALSDYKDPHSGVALKKVQEASYFFKMSKYHQRLMQHIQENPDFIQPEQHRNLILSRLKDDQLRDLSISRTTFSWGIPVPKGFDDNHVMYVWMDALSNYLTGVNGLGVAEDGSDLTNFWPASVHIIGKDILWFHTVIWPCLLMSAGVALPKTVFAHGFVNDSDGKKMSKSLGNVVDPHDMLDKFEVDTFRWYLCKEAPYGGELAFSEENMREMHNADLCDTLGNLVNRATNLCGKYCGGVIPDVPAPDKGPIDWKQVHESYVAKMDRFELQGGANVAISGCRDVNGYIQEEAPWKKTGDEQKMVVRAALEAVYALAHLLLPFVPLGASTIFKKLNTEPVKCLSELNADCRNLKVGTKIEIGDVLYKKLLSEAEMRNAADKSSKKKESFAEAQKRKKEEKAKQIAASSKGQQSDPNQPDFTKLDIRVGKLVKVWNHPEADKLFCEEIDVGEESGPREIASGLRQHYSLEEMQDRKVLVVCNLKPVKMLGFLSNGMVLAAKADDGSKVELIGPPEDAEIGERVFIEGVTGEPVSATAVKKKKVMENVAKDLRTAEGGVATWKDKVISTKAGPCKAPSLVGASIS